MGSIPISHHQVGTKVGIRIKVSESLDFPKIIQSLKYHLLESWVKVSASALASITVIQIA